MLIHVKRRQKGGVDSFHTDSALLPPSHLHTNAQNLNEAVLTMPVGAHTVAVHNDDASSILY